MELLASFTGHLSGVERPFEWTTPRRDFLQQTRIRYKSEILSSTRDPAEMCGKQKPRLSWNAPRRHLFNTESPAPTLRWHDYLSANPD